MSNGYISASSQLSHKCQEGYIHRCIVCVFLVKRWLPTAKCIISRTSTPAWEAESAECLNLHTHTNTPKVSRFRALNNTYTHSRMAYHIHIHTQTHTYYTATQGECVEGPCFTLSQQHLSLFISGDKATWYNSQRPTLGQHVNVAMKMKTGLVQNFNCPQKNGGALRWGNIYRSFKWAPVSSVMQNACKWAIFIGGSLKRSANRVLTLQTTVFDYLFWLWPNVTMYLWIVCNHQYSSWQLAPWLQFTAAIHVSLKHHRLLRVCKTI